MSQSGTYDLIFPQRSGSLEEENAKTQGRKDAKVVDLPQRSGCLEEENAKTQGRKDARVVDLPQRSGCLDRGSPVEIRLFSSPA